MTKVFKNFFGIILVFLLTLTAVSCDVKDNTPDKVDEDPIEEKTAVEKLNVLEKKTYDVLIENLHKFNNPSSVKVIRANYWGERFNRVSLQISAENQMGGTTNKVYVITHITFEYVFDDGSTATFKRGMTEDILGASTLSSSSPSDVFSVPNFNKAIEEYVTNNF